MYYWTSSIFNLCFGDCHCFINVSAIIDIWDVIAFVDVVKLWLPMLNFFLRCQSFGRINSICPYLSCIGVFLLSICLLFIEGCSVYVHCIVHTCIINHCNICIFWDFRTAKQAWIVWETACNWPQTNTWHLFNIFMLYAFHAMVIIWVNVTVSFMICGGNHKTRRKRLTCCNIRRKKDRPVTSHWQTSSHWVALIKSSMRRKSTHTLVIGTARFRSMYMQLI